MHSLDIIMLVPGMAIPDAEDILGMSLGGSETMGLQLAEALATAGHNVSVFANLGEPRALGKVRLLPIDGFRGAVRSIPHDVCIVQRIPGQFSMPTEAKLNILWLHDLGAARFAEQFSGVLWNIDSIVPVSEWHAQQIHESLGIEMGLLSPIGNGIPRESVFHPLPMGERDRNLCVYFARPERGMDVLLRHVWPRIRARKPDARLIVGGYENYVPDWSDLYQEVNAAIAADPTVSFAGSLAKRELYRLYGRAGLYLYPTPSPRMPRFAEVSCVSAMEAMASGLPIVTSARGALPETVRSAGYLVEGDPVEQAEEYATRAIELMENDGVWRSFSNTGIEIASTYRWSGRVEQWERMFDSLLGKANGDPVRRAYHFYRRQDIAAAEEAIELPLTGKGPAEARAMERLRKRIRKEYGFRSSKKAYRSYYEEVCWEYYAGHAEEFVEHPEKLDPENVVARFRQIGDIIEAFIRKRREDGDSLDPTPKVLDSGCAHGECACYLGRRFPDLFILGTDVSQRAIDLARRFAETSGVSNVQFSGPEDQVRMNIGFDVLILGEVLEHVVDPIRYLTDQLSMVREDGLVIVTVPYGPWETSGDGPPQHIREFEAHDLREMFGHFPDFEMTTWPSGICPRTGSALGYRIVTFTRGQAAPLPIDRWRKQSLQRPRQTLSVSMIVGGETAGDTLGWCLRSVRDVADEIVIADTGMTQEALRIAKSFGATVIPGSDPIRDGFETPRNESLDSCTMDWILWIDADERLVGAENLSKYLRPNGFASYAIQQHHFACDTHFRPDMPNRLFRREGWDGKKFRFFGMIHEHPELGEVNGGPGPVIVLADVQIAHVGYLNETIRRVRFRRNLPLMAADVRKYPERRIQKYLLMRDNLLMAKAELQQNGGQMVELVQRACRENIELYRKHFLGKPNIVGVDALEYYSDAVQILGDGFEVDLVLFGSRDGVRTGGERKGVWFASREDFETEVAARARAIADRFTNQWW